jgi:hypothetical protein
MIIYNTVVNLMKKLTPEETAMLKAHLTAYDRRGENKAAHFYNLVTGNGFDVGMKEAVHVLYPQGNEGSFLRFLLRIREKIEETLLLDINIKRTGAYTQRQQYFITIAKEIALIRLYKSRNEFEEAVRCINTVFEKATDVEAFSELLLALELLTGIPEQYRTGTTLRNENQYNKIKQQKEITDELNKLWSTLNETWDKPTVTEEICNRIAGYAAVKASHLTHTAEIYIKLCRAYIYKVDKDYYEAARLLKNNDAKLHQSPLKFEPELIFQNGIYRLEMLLYSYRFSEIIETGDIYQSMPGLSNENRCRILEKQFLACTHIRNYIRAGQELDDLLQLAAGKPKQLFQYRFWLGQLLILKGLYAEGADLIKELYNPKITPPESLFELGWSYIAGITLHNKNNPTSPEFNLSRFVKRFQRCEPKTEREVCIKEIIAELAETNFDFKAVYFRLQDKIVELASPVSPLAWQITDGELLRFNCWFDTLRSNVPFEIPVPRYKAYSDSLINSAEV